MKVKDKVVIITGAGSGIGAASGKLFGEHGAKVICADINLVGANKTALEIENDGGVAQAHEVNVADYNSVKNLIQNAVDSYGRIDVIVNNAGIGPKNLVKTADHDLEDWDTVVKVNQTGVFYCMKLALQQMEKQGFGNIVNVASLAGLKASGNNLSYSASKFAVVGMTKSAALEYGHKNIRINAVCPGYTRSALFDKMLDSRPDMDQILLKFIPMRRFGKASEIAEAIVWLAADNTSFITGQTITIDGGISL